MANFPAPSPKYIGPPNNHGPRTNKPVKHIVIHETQSPCEVGGARDIARYFKNTDRPASAHYIVDPSEVIQGLYDSYVGFAAPPNEKKLHVEVCAFSTTDPKKAKEKFAQGNIQRAYDRTALLVAQLCLSEGIAPRFCGPIRMRLGIKGVTTHAVISNTFKQSVHWDPGVWPRRKFMRQVRQHVRNAKKRK